MHMDLLLLSLSKSQVQVQMMLLLWISFFFMVYYFWRCLSGTKYSQSQILLVSPWRFSVHIYQLCSYMSIHIFIHCFIHLFYQHLLNSYHVYNTPRVSLVSIHSFILILPTLVKVLSCMVLLVCHSCIHSFLYSVIF